MKAATATPAYMKLLPADTISTLAKLELVAGRAMEGFVVGRHKSPFKGFSAEFAEHRQYVPGDDPGDLDWRVLARTDRYFIKQYEDETNLRATILLDASGSMRFAGERAAPWEGRPASKFDYGRLLAGALAYLLIQQQDAVGLVTFDTAVRVFVPARTRASHVSEILRQLGDAQPGGESALAAVFDSVAERVRRRGLLLVISDFFEEADALVRSLHHFAYCRHDVMLLHVMAAEELEFPYDRWSTFESLETNGRRLEVDPGALRAEYLDRLREHVRALRSACGRMQIDYLPFCTRDRYDLALANHLARRRRRK